MKEIKRGFLIIKRCRSFATLKNVRFKSLFKGNFLSMDFLLLTFVERNITCPNGQWMCIGSSRCIPVNKICNSEDDCGDRSDEGSRCRKCFYIFDQRIFFVG